MYIEMRQGVRRNKDGFFRLVLGDGYGLMVLSLCTIAKEGVANW